MLFTRPNGSFEKYSSIIDEINRNEILVQIEFTTICKSDLHTYFNRRSSPAPSVLGHEIVGKIVHVEGYVDDVDGNLLNRGDRITWSVYANDPDDIMAKKGIPQKSKSLYKYGHRVSAEPDVYNGGFATHCILKKNTAIVKLPENIPLETAAPINCTHATVAGAFRKAGDVKGKVVLISGAGMLGLSACVYAKWKGARKVIVTDIDSKRLRYAKRFGSPEVFDVADKKGSDFQSLKPEVVIETTGMAPAMEICVNSMEIGGVIVFIGAVFSQPKIKIDAEIIVRNILTIKGLHNYSPVDLAEAVAFIVHNHSAYPFAELTAVKFRLENLENAFVEAEKSGYYRVGIDPRNA